MQDYRWGFTRAEWKGRITSLYLLAILLLMQPSVQLAFWTESTCCQLLSSFSSTNTPKSFLEGLLSIPSLIPGVAPAQMQDLALGFVESHEVHMGPFLQVVQVPLDDILSLWMASHPSGVSTAALSLVSLTNLPRVHSIPWSMLLTKMLNSCCPNTNS